ncbi:TetR/AcrR family transcriptional regulator [Bacillus paramycoides]|uniref:TetR/AcrR family transcriptional regulator n=1 Tax=Bacillus paramycoides TaxID=2026194 RepID=UPI002E1F2A83|nr:TetR/AcrR family transcriptional regulator [Bacillus paramycoides]
MGNKDINEATKEAIYIALLQLMKKRDFQKITITDTTKRAGVSRMAFYRNFQSKGEILTNRLDELFKEYYEEILSKEVPSPYDFSVSFFIYFRNHNQLIKAMLQAQLHTELIPKFNQYLENIYTDIYKNRSINSYEIKFLVGGILNILISWIESNMKESNEDMAKIIERFETQNNLR